MFNHLKPLLPVFSPGISLHLTAQFTSSIVVIPCNNWETYSSLFELGYLLPTFSGLQNYISQNKFPAIFDSKVRYSRGDIIFKIRDVMSNSFFSPKTPIHKDEL